MTRYRCESLDDHSHEQCQCEGERHVACRFDPKGAWGCFLPRRCLEHASKTRDGLTSVGYEARIVLVEAFKGSIWKHWLRSIQHWWGFGDRCEFETDAAGRIVPCLRSGQFHVAYSLDDIVTITNRRYCRHHALRVCEYFTQAGVTAQIVPE